MDDEMLTQMEENQAMFVQVAGSMTRDGARLAFHDVAPATSTSRTGRSGSSVTSRWPR